MERKRVHDSTLLSLVAFVQDKTRTDAEAVAIIAHLINSGQVRLRGTFAGIRQIRFDKG